MTEDFSVLLKVDGEWLHFENPSEIISANNAEEVLPALQKLDDYIVKSKAISGYISYEAASGLDSAFANHGSRFPLLKFGVFDSWKKIKELSSDNYPFKTAKWQLQPPRADFTKSIRKIKEFIASGDTYQVNYTIRMESDFEGDAFSYFKFLVENQPAAYAGFINQTDFAICSASPELFFSLKGDTLVSQPMKGTAARGLWFEDDQIKGRSLKNSEKDRAENLMITDMIRNDMGKICRPGTVKTQKIFSVKRLPTVWQMTSEVTGKSSAQFSQIMKALFPCASITGAPKASTMAIIKKLEPTPRKIYTGSIGCFLPGRQAQFNVAIRTAVIDHVAKKAEYGVGSGIVWDSEALKEYQECKIKALVLKKRPQNFALIETMLFENDQFFLKDYHVKRLCESAEYFGFNLNLKKVDKVLNHITNAYKNTKNKVRLLLDKRGNITTEISPVSEPEMQTELKIGFSKRIIRTDNPFLYHKTTVRNLYNLAHKEAKFRNLDDILLINNKGEITESTISNIVIKVGSSYFTPPLKSGLLPGTFRQYLTDNGKISESAIIKNDIKNADEIYLINSVRKWQKAILADVENN